QAGGKKAPAVFVAPVLQLWDVMASAPVGPPLQGPAAFSPNGRLVADGGRDGTVGLRNADTGLIVGQPLGQHSDRILAVAFRPDGRALLTASADKTAQVWDVLTGRRLIRALPHPAPVQEAQFSPDGRSIVTFWRVTKGKSGSDEARAWDAATGKP